MRLREIMIITVENTAIKSNTTILGTPASNGRFGASGAVARPKVCANLEVLRPSERQWKPRLRQAAGTLGDTRGRQCENRLNENKK